MCLLIKVLNLCDRNIYIYERGQGYFIKIAGNFDLDARNMEALEESGVAAVLC